MFSIRSFEESIGIPLYQQTNVRAYRDYVYDGYVPIAKLPNAWEDIKRLK